MPKIRTMEALSMHTNEFVNSYFDAWNHHDPKGIAEHLSPDGVYIDVPEHSTRSPDELIGRLKEFFNQHWHHYELTGDIVTTENTIAFQYRIFPRGDEAKSASSVSYRGAEFMTLKGDAAVAITDYYDYPEKARAGKYAKSGLSRDQLLRYKQILNQIMCTQKAYLQPDLTLPNLAELVGCSVNHLSQVINDGFGQSFFGYLNHYRIESARELLRSPDSRATPILDIAFKVGFNSNSTFYSAFKKRVGISPARYRLQHLNDPH